MAGGIAFIGDDFGTIYGFNARTGAKIWSRRVGGEINGLAVAGGRVYVSSEFIDGQDSIIFALNQATGVIEDSIDIGKTYMSEPVVAGGAIYVTANEEATDPSVLYAVG